jgi:hypothetical protein
VVIGSMAGFALIIIIHICCQDFYLDTKVHFWLHAPHQRASSCYGFRPSN